jgi:GTP-binding protein
VELGFEKIFPVTAIHGEGIEPLVDAAVALLPESKEAVEIEGEVLPDRELQEGETIEDAPRGSRRTAALRLAIVGRPNVGKSSIINALTKSDRVIVSPIPGTTRDSVDVPFKVETEGRLENYILVDTAGMRKARRVDDSIEFFSVQRAQDSIARCDIAVLVLDAEAGITEQDKKVAEGLHRGGE